jgi:hypothetical protein
MMLTYTNMAVIALDGEMVTKQRGKIELRVKSLLKYIFIPSYRRSYQVASYLRHGYTIQEALAKVKVIEA